MADDSEEKSSISHDFSNTKTAIFQTFNKLKKWREEQFEQFRNLQYLESQKIIQLSGESQKQFEKLLGNASKNIDAEERPKNHIPENPFLSLKNDVETYDTLHESSLTGHLQRCFDDSATNSFSASENKGNHVTQQTTVFKDAPNSQKLDQNVNAKQDQQVRNASDSSLSAKLKRPFLRKGTGLLRYMPKSPPNDQQRKKKGPFVQNTPVKTSCLPQKTLQLKPAIRKTDIPSENVRHIRFDIPVEGNEESFTENYTPFTSESFENKIDDDDVKGKYSSLSPSSPDHSPQRNSKLDIHNSETGSLNLTNENKELEEFEMLENCVQNSSFNSDSSVVQKFLHGDKPVPVIQKEILKPALSGNVNTVFKETFKNPSESSIFSAKVGLSKCLEEAHARKEILQKVISDINPRIQSLQKEIYRSQHEAVDDSDISERCSTPVENLNLGDRITPSLFEDCSEVVSSDIQVSHPKSSARFDDDNDICQTHCKSCHSDDGVEDLLLYDDNLAEEASVSEELDDEVENQQVLDDRSKIRNKLKELEKEIEIYQDLNSKLSSNCKERNEFLKKLQKEREEFNKYKETEKKKLEAEINEERRQIKRQKETFNRYQKLRKDNPTRKERDELNALRQEIEKLQEELKRQKIKYTSDSRRWKNQLETAEREKDTFKLENIRLEEQCQDLLTALKTRIKKKTDPKISDKTDNGTGHENLTKVLPITKDAESQTESKCFTSDQSNVSKQVSPKNSVKKTKTKVRFNLSPEHQRNELENVCEDVEDTQDNLLKDDFQCTENTVTVIDNQDRSRGKNTEVNLSTISVSVECEFKEIDHGNKIERIYDSGDREMIFHSGTRKIISADGKVKFLFYNGDIKEIFPDKHEVYRYVNGITETHFPDGLEVTEFPSGQIQKRYPDGQKEVTFTDGTVHNTFADGSEESRSGDGNVVILGTDGTRTIEFANGQREIRTATYKRREFPDGAVKIHYDSGRQETRYPNGRIRIKDKEGKVLFDTKYLGLTKD